MLNILLLFFLLPSQITAKEGTIITDGSTFSTKAVIEGPKLVKVEELTSKEIETLEKAKADVEEAEKKYQETQDNIAEKHGMARSISYTMDGWYKIEGKFILYYLHSFYLNLSQ